MNADRADTRSPHLDLGDLIAGAAGQPVGDQARGHLAGCGNCQREAKRWNLVADGIRGLADAAPETVPEEAQHGRPPGAGRRVLAGPWRRAMLVVGSAAAALVLFIGVGELAGVVHVHLSLHRNETVLAAVTGCSQLELATGTLEHVNGSSLVIKTASGQPVIVTAAANTSVSMSGALLSDITDGASVMVRGSRFNGTINAAIVTVGQPFSAVNPAGFVPVQGTVAKAGSAGFTLVTSSGARIPVTTSGGTLVVIPHASTGQLHVGVTILAVGHAGPDGTLLARAVAAVSQLPSGVHVGVRVKDCSPSSVETALGKISSTPRSANG